MRCGCYCRGNNSTSIDRGCNDCPPLWGNGHRSVGTTCTLFVFLLLSTCNLLLLRCNANNASSTLLCHHAMFIYHLGVEVLSMQKSEYQNKDHLFGRPLTNYNAPCLSLCPLQHKIKFMYHIQVRSTFIVVFLLLRRSPGAYVTF